MKISIANAKRKIARHQITINNLQKENKKLKRIISDLTNK
jgi:hypothetical protein